MYESERTLQVEYKILCVYNFATRFFNFFNEPVFCYNIENKYYKNINKSSIYNIKGLTIGSKYELYMGCNSSNNNV